MFVGNFVVRDGHPLSNLMQINKLDFLTDSQSVFPLTLLSAPERSELPDFSFVPLKRLSLSIYYGVY